MTRPLRTEYAGAVYHFTARNNEKKSVVKDDQDRLNFLKTFQQDDCLMNNQYQFGMHFTYIDIGQSMNR